MQIHGPHGGSPATSQQEKQVQITFDVKQDLKKLMAIGALSLALVIGSAGTANATTANRDRNGLTDAQEKITKTSPAKAYTDRDGIKDGDEDRDRDGVDNTNELRLKLKMNDANSDNDAVLDGDEYRDGDGIDNEDEDDTEASADPFAPGGRTRPTRTKTRTISTRRSRTTLTKTTTTTATSTRRTPTTRLSRR